VADRIENRVRVRKRWEKNVRHTSSSFLPRKYRPRRDVCAYEPDRYFIIDARRFRSTGPPCPKRNRVYVLYVRVRRSTVERNFIRHPGIVGEATKNLARVLEYGAYSFVARERTSTTYTPLTVKAYSPTRRRAPNGTRLRKQRIPARIRQSEEGYARRTRRHVVVHRRHFKRVTR